MHPLHRAIHRVLGPHATASLLATLAVLVVVSPAAAATTPLHLTVRNLTLPRTNGSGPLALTPLLAFAGGS